MAPPEEAPPNDPTETSPLLANGKSGKKVHPPTLEADTGALPDGTAHRDAEAADAVEGDRLLARTADSDGRAQQYAGIPDLKKHLAVLFPALSLGVLLAATDQTLVVSSYGRIGSDLGALNKVSWIATAYFLALTSCQPLYGKLSDIFSRKSCLLTAYFIFGLGSLLCGLSQTIDQLILARGFAGIGGAGMTTVVSIILSDVIPLKERGQWQGYINIVYASGAALGAPLGGFFADGPGWRWSFLFQPPLCAVAILIVGFALKLPPRDDQKSHWRQKLRRIDFLGAVLLVATVSTLLTGLDRGSNVSWKSQGCLIPLCLSVPLCAAFIYVEARVAKEPFAPARVLAERTLLAGFLCNLFAIGGYMGTLFYLPLHYAVVYEASASRAGLWLIPQIIAGVSGSLFAGFYMRKTGHYFRLTVVCYVFLVLGLVLVTVGSGFVGWGFWLLLVGAVVCGFSNGIGVTATLIAIISNCTRDDQAISTACAYLFRSLGSTVGVALSSSVAQQVLRLSLKDELGSGRQTDRIVDGVRKSLAYIWTLEPEVRRVVQRSYQLSTRAAFALQIGIVSGALIAALFIREKPLSG